MIPKKSVILFYFRYLECIELTLTEIFLTNMLFLNVLLSVPTIFKQPESLKYATLSTMYKELFKTKHVKCVNPSFPPSLRGCTIHPIFLYNGQTMKF